MKNRLLLLTSAGITAGTAIGIIIDNVPAAMSLGMIIGVLTGLFIKIVSNN